MRLLSTRKLRDFGFGLITLTLLGMLITPGWIAAQTAVAPSYPLVALICTDFGNEDHCDGLKQWNNDGGTSPYTPSATNTLVITDIECKAKPGSALFISECSLGDPTKVLVLEAESGKSGTVYLSTHLTTGISFTGDPGIQLTGVPQYVRLQGYLVPKKN